jgi:hypothetical protein
VSPSTASSAEAGSISPHDPAEARAGGGPGVAAPASLTLPKGGGAIRGIDEKFSTNPATGTASFAVPVPLSPGRGGFMPTLALAYDSGSGNGVFGHGWSLGVPMIARKTDKGLPRYRDADGSDTFTLSGAEDLVPTLDAAGSPDIRDETEGGATYRVQRFRPRIEGLFARIERWTRAGDGDVHWRTHTPDNVRTLYGVTGASRVADPADGERIYEWLIEEVRDDRGNVTVYEYVAEDGRGVDPELPEEGHRRGGAFAQRHLKRVRYANATPHAADAFHLELVLDYGDHDDAVPTPAPSRPWPVRADRFSSYRASFEVRTYRLCRRLLVFHSFAELGPQPALVRSLDLAYAENAVLTKLVSMTERGYIRDGAGYRSESMPPIELDYAEPALSEEVRELEPGALEHLPVGPDGRRYQWADLDGDGLQGVLAEADGAWFYKRNLGGGRFTPAQLVGETPSLHGLATGRVRLLDVESDGRLDLVDLAAPGAGFFGRSEDGGWEPFRAFRSLPTLRFDDPNVRFVDLDGDGRADVLVTEDDVFRWHASLGADGFAPAESVAKARDEERGPTLVLAEATQSVYLSDMSGDGLADLVRIRNGEVCYWPSLGFGRFGAPR